MHQTEKETLQKAAMSAQALLEKLIRQRARLDERIKALEAVVRAWEAISGKSLPPSTPKKEEEGSRPRGTLRKGIEEILQEGRAMTWEEIRDEYKKRFGNEPLKTSVFSTLRRLKGYGKVTNEDRRWRWVEGDASKMRTSACPAGEADASMAHEEDGSAHAAPDPSIPLLTER